MNCKGCADCCKRVKSIMILPSRFELIRERRPDIVVNSKVLANFHLIECNEDGCPFLNKKTLECEIYDIAPYQCLIYPFSLPNKKGFDFYFDLFWSDKAKIEKTINLVLCNRFYSFKKSDFNKAIKYIREFLIEFTRIINKNSFTDNLSLELHDMDRSTGYGYALSYRAISMLIYKKKFKGSMTFWVKLSQMVDQFGFDLTMNYLETIPKSFMVVYQKLDIYLDEMQDMMTNNTFHVHISTIEENEEHKTNLMPYEDNENEKKERKEKIREIIQTSNEHDLDELLIKEGLLEEKDFSNAISDDELEYIEEVIDDLLGSKKKKSENDVDYDLLDEQEELISEIRNDLNNTSQIEKIKNDTVIEINKIEDEIIEEIEKKSDELKRIRRKKRIIEPTNEKKFVPPINKQLKENQIEIRKDLHDSVEEKELNHLRKEVIVDDKIIKIADEINRNQSIITAKNFDKKPVNKLIIINKPKRSSILKKYSYDRANGICECCEKRVFRRENGRFSLKSYSLWNPSDFGVDEFYNYVSVCAYCMDRLMNSSKKEEWKKWLQFKVLNKIYGEASSDEVSEMNKTLEIAEKDEKEHNFTTE